MTINNNANGKDGLAKRLKRTVMTLGIYIYRRCKQHSFLALLAFLGLCSCMIDFAWHSHDFNVALKHRTVFAPYVPWAVLGVSVFIPAIASVLFLPDTPHAGAERYHEPPKFKLTREFVAYIRDHQGYQIAVAIWGFVIIVDTSYFEDFLKMQEKFPFHIAGEIGIALLVAAVVSGIFDIKYHHQIIGRYLSRLDREVDDLSNTVGYKDYRQLVLDGFAAAEKRIFTITDHWVIDSEWWRQPNEWKTCRLYTSLTDGKCTAETIVFAGKMPWPDYDDANRCLKCLEPQEFQRVLGLAWRHVVASYVREYRSKHSVGGASSLDVRVVYADIPISATVRDNDVYYLLETNADSVWQLRGTKLTGRPSGDLTKTTERTKKQEQDMADAFEDLLHRYVSHARSAREYLQSLLCLVELSTDALNETSVINDDAITTCLNLLGMEQWLKRGSELNAPKDNSTKAQISGNNNQTLSEVELRVGALVIMREFIKRLQFYPGNDGSPTITFGLLRKDLV